MSGCRSGCGCVGAGPGPVEAEEQEEQEQEQGDSRDMGEQSTKYKPIVHST
jgi:hypothetical protein